MQDQEMDKKLEKCVVDVMAQGKDKATAMKICQSSMMKKPTNKKVSTMSKVLKAKIGTKPNPFAKGM